MTASGTSRRDGSAIHLAVIASSEAGSEVDELTSRVTVRVTPNQAAGNIPGPSGSGTVTPRTGSYAGAVKTAPSGAGTEMGSAGNSPTFSSVSAV